MYASSSLARKAGGLPNIESTLDIGRSRLPGALLPGETWVGEPLSLLKAFFSFWKMEGFSCMGPATCGGLEGIWSDKTWKNINKQSVWLQTIQDI